jgi:hypothetical protein
MFAARGTPRDTLGSLGRGPVVIGFIRGARDIHFRAMRMAAFADFPPF